MREKESPNAKAYRIWHKRLNPLKYMTLFTYVFLTQFERPDWCLDIILNKNGDNPDEKYEYFDEWYCNDSDEGDISEG